MKTIELKAQPRKEVGKKNTKKLRSKGLVPCVMYGGEQVVHFTVPEIELRHILYTADVYVVLLNVDGKSYKAILKESQFHPVNDKALHMDFVEVSDDKVTIVELPVAITGTSEGILAGGKLRQRRRYLKVRGLIKDMPDTLAIDITELEIGDFVKVDDLDFPNLELLDPGKSMIVGVTASRISKGMEEGELEGAAEVEETEEGAETPAEGEEGEAPKEEAPE